MTIAHRIHVLTRKEELDRVRIADKVAVVLDVLFATSTMITALAHGAREVQPVAGERAARAAARAQPPGSCVLSGELNAITLEQMVPPTPLALVDHGVAGRRVILSTTNGTVAMRACSAAHRIYAGALLNAGALVEHLLTAHPRRTLLLVCSGSASHFNLEDFYGAGCLVDLMARELGERADFSDAARAARALYRHREPFESLADCRVGRMSLAHGLERELRYASQVSALNVVPVLDGAVLASL